jgi:hypothetical protein
MIRHRKYLLHIKASIHLPSDTSKNEDTRHQLRYNKALHPTAYSSVPFARKLAAVSALPAAGVHRRGVFPVMRAALGILNRIIGCSHSGDMLGTSEYINDYKERWGLG